MKVLLALLVTAVLMGGCSYKEYNAAVERQNSAAFKAFAEGMSKQTSEAGRLALSIVYVTGSGRQALAKPETLATYLPMVNGLIMPWVAIFAHHDDDSTTQSLSAGRDIYLQSSNDSTHAGHELMSFIKGDNNTNNQKICPTCNEDFTPGDGEDDAESCEQNPPAGYRGSTPLYDKDCSCRSHYSGRC